MTSHPEPTANPTTAPTIRRRILLINPRFQVSVIFQGILLVVVVMALFYFYESLFLLRVTETVKNVAAQNSTDSMPVINAIESLHTEMFPWFLLVLATVSISIFSFLLFFSHRIAGPIYHACNYLNAVGDNPKNRRRIEFREKDHFHELAHAINHAIPTEPKN